MTFAEMPPDPPAGLGNLREGIGMPMRTCFQGKREQLHIYWVPYWAAQPSLVK